jgi:hypothetical protein
VILIAARSRATGSIGAGGDAMTAKLLRIDLQEGEAGLWHARSPDLPEFRLTDTSRAEVLVNISFVLRAFHQINGQPIAAFQVKPEHADDLRWVIIPVSELRALLSEAQP